MDVLDLLRQLPTDSLDDDRCIRTRMEQGHAGRMPYSWLYFDLVKNITTEKTSYPCQIPSGLFPSY